MLNPYGEHATLMMFESKSDKNNIKMFGLEYCLGHKGEMFIELNEDAPRGFLRHVCEVLAEAGIFGKYENSFLTVKEMIEPIQLCNIAESYHHSARLFFNPRSNEIKEFFQQYTKQELSLNKRMPISSGEILSKSLFDKAEHIIVNDLKLPHKQL